MSAATTTSPTATKTDGVTEPPSLAAMTRTNSASAKPDISTQATKREAIPRIVHNLPLP